MLSAMTSRHPPLFQSPSCVVTPQVLEGPEPCWSWTSNMNSQACPWHPSGEVTGLLKEITLQVTNFSFDRIFFHSVLEANRNNRWGLKMIGCSKKTKKRTEVTGRKNPNSRCWSLAVWTPAIHSTALIGPLMNSVFDSMPLPSQCFRIQTRD